MTDDSRTRRLFAALSSMGVDLSNLVPALDFLADEGQVEGMITSTHITPEFLKAFSGILTFDARMIVFDRIVEGKEDWRLLEYLGISRNMIENAVVEGALPREAITYAND